MIAQFYNKFDELHEQSLTAALAKSPNKQSIKNEVKYRIPQRWTKNFHKNDIVSLEILKDSGIVQERGKVNRNTVLEKRNALADKRDKSLVMQINGQAPINNPILHHSLSSRRADLEQSPPSNQILRKDGKGASDVNLQFQPTKEQMENSPSLYDANGVYVGDTQTEAQSKVDD